MPSKQPKNSAEPFVPATRSLTTLRTAASHCRGCDLYRHATQTVFGEGPRQAELLILGEQPGDREDLEGRPFVGPAGMLLKKAMAEAGIAPNKAYVTNVVKHFKHQVRGKRRIHQKPKSIEIEACRPWLEAECKVLQPKLILCLGATAAQALFGKQFRVTEERGRFSAHEYAPHVLATVHPSSLLRITDQEERRGAYAAFVRDLRKAKHKLEHLVSEHANAAAPG